MASWEIPFETAAMAYEVTRNTAVTPPTHRIPLSGTPLPVDTWSEKEETQGVLAELHRSTKTGETATWSFSGDVDSQFMPFLMQMHVKGSISPTTPAGTVRLWTGVPDMTADTLKSATLYSGDPNTGSGQVLQYPFAVSTNLVITADAMSTDAAQITWEGVANSGTPIAAPALPATSLGVGLIPRWLQLYVDTSSAIGTTEITGRVLSVEGRFPNNIAMKPTTGAPGSNTLGYSRIGRGKVTPEMSATFEMVDFTQFSQWKNGDKVKVRARISGPLIESTYYHFLEWDMVGYWHAPGWGDLEGTNRTLTMTLRGLYDSTLAANYILRSQNTKATV